MIQLKFMGRYGALLTVIVATLLSCKKLQEPEYIDVNNLRIQSNGGYNTTLSADVRFYNPNRQNISLKSGNLDIYIENRKLGHTELDSTINIPKRDTFLIPVNIQVDLTHLLSNALTLAMKDSVLVRLEGKVKIGRSGVFLTKPVKYETKERLDLLNGLW